METTIIHIGYHKSASTFLQKQVFPLLPVNYIFFAGEDRQILNMIESGNGLDSDAIRSWVNEEIARNYPQNKHAITVLSHEELSGHPHGYNSISAFTIAKNIKQIFPNAKILIIIRNQLDYLTSLYTFRVAIKGRETRSFYRFLKEEGEMGLFEHLEYHLLVEHYQQLFGKELVAVFPMELLLTSPNDFYSKLFSFLGIPSQAIDNTRPTNVSTKNVFVLGFWRPVNYLFSRILDLRKVLFGASPDNFQQTRSSYYNFKRSMTGALNKLLANSQPINIIRLPETSGLLDRFAESNYHLQSMLNIDLSKFGYPVKSQ